MIEEFAEDFWRGRAAAVDGSIRWTDDVMLTFDVELLDRVVESGAAALDLGCGTGDLFLPFLERLDHVTAVDMIPEFLDRLPSDRRIERVVSTIGSFVPSREYDVAWMFGVVTHLSKEDEERAYRVLRESCSRGTVVVKNQCGRIEDVLVDDVSSALGSRYVGRYPALETQRARLGEHFAEVTVVPYPDEVNRWPDTLHVAFVCRSTRR